MNKTKSLFAIIYLAITFLMACETEDRTFKGPYFVRFTESADFKKESYTDTLSIEVHLAGLALSDDIVVGYNVGGTAREGVDYEIIGDRGKITIPAGEYFGTLKFRLINNANNILSSQDIIFTLNTVSETSLRIGQGTGQIGKLYTFTIFDDCILGGVYNEHIANYLIEDIPIASVNCESYTISGAYIIAEETFFSVNFDFIDNNNNSLTVEEQKLDGLPQGENTVTGTGTVNPITKEITISLVLEDIDGKPTTNFALQPR